MPNAHVQITRYEMTSKLQPTVQAFLGKHFLENLCSRFYKYTLKFMYEYTTNSKLMLKNIR